MVDGLIGFRVLQDHIQIIAKIYRKGGMTCWKILQKASKLYVFICSVQLGGRMYRSYVRLQIIKKNEFAPEKLPPIRIALIAYVPVDGVTKGIFCTPSTGSKSNNRV